MNVKSKKIKMYFWKNDKIKKEIIDWEDVTIKETKKNYIVVVEEDSLFHEYFSRKEECRLIKNV